MLRGLLRTLSAAPAEPDACACQVLFSRGGSTTWPFSARRHANVPTRKVLPMNRVSVVLTAALATAFASQAATAQTLKTVKDRGQLSCGVSQGLPGFSAPDDKGNWAGLDVDVCRAIAAAVFGDAGKVKF